MEVKVDNPHHQSSLANIFASYFEKEDHVDVTFVCAGGRKVKGHKLILSFLSPFLKKLFSECSGDQGMTTVLLPDVNGNIMKLFFDFMYEGTAKLSRTELDGFKAIQDMLEIRFPGIMENECPTQQPPRTRPPPLLKLDNKIQSVHQATSLQRNKNAGERQTETAGNTNDNHVLKNNAGERSTPVDDPRDRRPGDPDDDPLNIPDLYFLPTNSSVTSQTQGASNDAGETGQSHGHVQRATRSVNGYGTWKTNSIENGQSGVRKRPYSRIAAAMELPVDVPSAVNSEQAEGRRTGKRSRGVGNVPHTDRSASNVADTGGVQSRQIRTRKT